MAEALLERLDAGVTIYCPAFAQNGRTVYNGHLFVGGELLSDSGMRNHPLTPMTDANLVRLLRAGAEVGEFRRRGLLRKAMAMLPPGDRTARPDTGRS